MSRVYFHSPSGEAELRGSERAHAGWLTSAIGIAALDLSAESLPFIERKFAGRVSRPEDVAAAEVSLRVGSASFALPSGRYGAWEVLLNTCLVLGSDPLCFLARMHAQCEIHAWVDGPDRAWLAGIIDEGRRVGLMRDGQGWDDVTALLRARSDEPVVMSYSVCDQFPSRSVANWTPPADEDGEPNRDAWYDLDEAERWRLAMDGVQELRFGPETLRTSFGHCKSALDIKREIHEATRAQTREETIARLALLVGDRGEAQRAVELAERVGIEEAAASPVALASERVDAYVQTVFNIAARGEPLPTTTEELRGTAEARQRCAEDMMRALTGIR